MNLKHLYLFVLLIASPLFLCSQSSCEYNLRLFDTFGDGWAGGSVDVTIGNNTVNYTLDGENDNGAFKQFPIVATDGDTIIINYNEGSFDIDNSYRLLNPEGIEIFSDGQLPELGEVFNGVVTCPTCFVTNPSFIFIDDVRASTTAISWVAPDSNVTYQIEYGEEGFSLGAGTTIQTQETQAILSNLQENTGYEFYMKVLCTDGDESTTVGPYPFMTRWSVDVALTEIVGPETACMIGRMDSIKVTLRNFGGDPQALIPFKFSVNGQDGGVPDFLDGFYTDVLSKDSMVTVAFETLYDFSAPGVYEITAWTQFENDSDLLNDTSTITVVNVPVITSYPYFEDFETWIGGWTIGPDSENATWERGNPIGPEIRGSKSGRNAYVTNLTGQYDTLEVSNLLSPCYNFTSLSEDPQIVFALNVLTEPLLDNAWLEMSIDGGEIWEKVGQSGTGLNWYNDPDADTWTGDGGFDGWQFAVNTLMGAAGQPDVRLRFVFSADFADQEEGIGIDDIFIAVPTENDLAAVNVVNQADKNCGDTNDQVVFTILNLGTTTKSNFPVSYQINGGDIATEIVSSLSLEPGAQGTYTIGIPFDSSEPGTYTITAWTDLNNDSFLGTDTTTFTFSTVSNVPYTEDFEVGVLPLEWTTDEDVIVANEHGNTSFVLYNNMWSGDPTFEAVSPRIGLIEQGDSLVFDYRIVDFTGGGTIGTTLGEMDNIIVQISTDCGVNYDNVLVIDQNNHQTSVGLTTINIPLSAYAGEYIRVRFVGNWGSGDYFVDIDNVNVPRCSGDLGLVATIKDATGENDENGRISLQPTAGVAPYTYEWSNGASSSTISNLSPMLYQVTVTDRFGCSEAVDFSIIVGTEDEIEVLDYANLYPNPTTGVSNLEIGLQATTELRYEVFNLMGQRIVSQVIDKAVGRVDIPIDLSGQSDGIYILRVWVGQEYFAKQLNKSNQ